MFSSSSQEGAVASYTEYMEPGLLSKARASGMALEEYVLSVVEDAAAPVKSEIPNNRCATKPFVACWSSARNIILALASR